MEFLIVAKRKSLFDDKPVEIAELTYVIKQDLSSINSQIGSLQALVRSQHPNSSKSGEGQEGEHAKNVVVMLQGKLADVSVGFKEILEVRTKNIQASRSRTENFVSNVSGRAGEGEFRLRKNPSTPAGEGIHCQFTPSLFECVSLTKFFVFFLHHLSYSIGITTVCIPTLHTAYDTTFFTYTPWCVPLAIAPFP